MIRLRPGPADPASIAIVPANEASWEDLQAIFGVRGYPASCQCQFFKIGHAQWTAPTVAERMERLRAETQCGYPSARTTSGLVAYLDGEPVGWCAVEPRTAYPRLPPARVAWTKRDEDMNDASVWAVTCFVTRAGFRRRGLTRVLVKAAVKFARERGARALEGYPMITEPGQEVTWGETHVGTRNIFEDAGFTEVARATLRRVVMRIDFDAPGSGAPTAARVTNVLFIQGGSTGAHDADAWLADSLRDELGAGFEVRFPEMVEEDEPDVAAWGRQIDRELEATSGDVIVVGHSIGASVVLKHMSERDRRSRVRGVFLLATPSWGTDDFWHWEACTLDPAATRRLTRHVPVALYHAVDDEVVPFNHLERNRGLVPGASVHVLPEGGHQYDNDLGFLARDIRRLVEAGGGLPAR